VCHSEEKVGCGCEGCSVARLLGFVSSSLARPSPPHEIELLAHAAGSRNNILRP